MDDILTEGCDNTPNSPSAGFSATVPRCEPPAEDIIKTMASQVVVRSRAPVGRFLLAAALVTGVIVGAISCATGLALGVGHSGHSYAQPEDHPQPSALAATPAGSTHAHSSGESRSAARAVRIDAEFSDPGVSVSSSKSTPDPTNESSPIGEAHPGMACVTSERFAATDVVVYMTVSRTVSPPTSRPFGCVVEPDPPVPKFS